MTTIETKIERVTLYKNGALIERSGRARVGVVEVGRLPLQLSWPSFRIRPSAGGIVDVTESAHLEVEEGSSPLDGANIIHELELKLTTLRMKMTTTKTLLKSLSSAQPTAQSKDQDAPESLLQMPHWAQMPRWIEEESLRLMDEHARWASEFDEVKRDLDREQERRQVVPSPARAYRGAMFELVDVPTNSGSDDVEISIEYFVPGARWVPSYALDLVGDKGELTLFAMVANASGEAWTGAKLSFSTVDLARETTLPEVLSWRIGRRQDSRRPAYRDLPSGLEALFDAYDRGRERALDAGSEFPEDAGPIGSMGGIDMGVGGGGGDVEPADTAVFEAPPAPVMRSSAPLSVAAPAMSFDSMEESVEIDAMLEDDEFDDDSEDLVAVAPRSSSMFGSSKKMRMRAPSPKKEAAMEMMGGGTDDPLPPSLRTMALQLRGPHEEARGTLIPLGAQEHLRSLVDADDVMTLNRAFQALERAIAGLWYQALPHGTEALSETTPPTIFHGTKRSTIDDDGEFHRVAVHQMGANGEAELRVVPRESDDVFRYFLFDLEAGISLPDGPLDVSEDGTFRVRSWLTTAGTSRRLELNLGVDPGMRVLGRVPRIRQEEKGLVSTASIVEHTVDLTLRSTKAEPCRLRVFDRIPVADENEKDVEVNVTRSDPPLIRSDKAPDGTPCTGGVEWRLVVESGETLKISHSYEIKLPAKSELVGGNRRE